LVKKLSKMLSKICQKFDLLLRLSGEEEEEEEEGEEEEDWWLLDQVATSSHLKKRLTLLCFSNKIKRNINARLALFCSNFLCM
jgi:hypothetical protein